ncbi:MAG: GDSL-type esterase/lipase family protein [Xanthobacteraceae bacterium]
MIARHIVQFLSIALCAIFALPTIPAASAEPIVIVAIGASNTWGWGVPSDKSYPSQLQVLLRARGYDVDVKNAGVNFETTNGMLARIDSAVPAGTQLVIIQPGGNDLRFLGTKERRTANINAMVAKLNVRKIKSIVYDPVFEAKYYQWDTIHINVEGHTMIASSLLQQVIAVIAPQRRRASAPRAN